MTVPRPQYIYRAQLDRIIDGDTFAAVIDLGCHVRTVRPIRLLGVDTPELVGATAAAGRAARDWALAWLCAAGRDGGAWPLVVETTLDRSDKYGRLLGRVWRVSDEQELGAALIAAGHAVAYGGGARG